MDLPSHLIRHYVMPSDEDYKYASLIRRCKISQYLCHDQIPNRQFNNFSMADPKAHYYKII